MLSLIEPVEPTHSVSQECARDFPVLGYPPLMSPDEPTLLAHSELLVEGMLATLEGIVAEPFAAFSVPEQDMYRRIAGGIVLAMADQDENASYKVRGLVTGTRFLYPLFEETLALAQSDREVGEPTDYLPQLLTCFGSVEGQDFIEELFDLPVEEGAARIIATVLGREHGSSNNIRVARTHAAQLDPAQLHVVFGSILKAEQVLAAASSSASANMRAREAVVLVAVYAARTALGHFSEETQNKIYDSLLQIRQRVAWATEIWEQERTEGWEKIVALLPSLESVEVPDIMNVQARGQADDTLDRARLVRQELRTLLNKVGTPLSATTHRKMLFDSKTDKFYRKPGE